jgi:hypothetical protein
MTAVCNLCLRQLPTAPHTTDIHPSSEALLCLWDLATFSFSFSKVFSVVSPPASASSGGSCPSSRKTPVGHAFRALRQDGDARPTACTVRQRGVSGKETEGKEKKKLKASMTLSKPALPLWLSAIHHPSASVSSIVFSAPSIASEDEYPSRRTSTRHSGSAHVQVAMRCSRASGGTFTDNKAVVGVRSEGSGWREGMRCATKAAHRPSHRGEARRSSRAQSTNADFRTP